MQDNGMSLVGVQGVGVFTRRVCNHEWYFTSEGLLVRRRANFQCCSFGFPGAEHELLKLYI